MDLQNNISKLVLKSLFQNFYNNDKNIIFVSNIINRKVKYSRRILEWFCSNYSKRKNIIINLKNGKTFDVFKSYKLQLDSFHKKTFDAFKRKRDGYIPFILKYKEDGEQKQIETTVGQLNFFKWCIENEIINYIENNIKDIKEDMKVYSKNKEKIKTEKVVVTQRVKMKKFDGVKLIFS